jgi:hypothetical protein
MAQGATPADSIAVIKLAAVNIRKNGYRERNWQATSVEAVIRSRRSLSKTAAVPCALGCYGWRFPERRDCSQRRREESVRALLLVTASLRADGLLGLLYEIVDVFF